jgi:hypothetical protein
VRRLDQRLFHSLDKNRNSTMPDQRRKKSGLDIVSSALSRQAKLILQNAGKGMMSDEELKSTIEIGKVLATIDNARTNGVMRALSQRYRSTAELKELLLALQSRDDEDEDDEGSEFGN